MTSTNNQNTALQVTNFDFYGDNLIALQDNATGEIYTAINSVLRGIGFTERQVRHNRDKWLNDLIVSKGCQNFVIPMENGVSQETYCISNRKLPIALTKISITPKMKQSQPELVSKLELYQDKCADVLASVFIDHRMPNQPNLQPLIDSLSILTQTITIMQQDINILKESQTIKKLPEKKYSRWKTNTFNKLNTLLSYVNTHSEETMKLSEIIHLVIQETEDTYGIEMNDYVDAYKSEFNMDTNPYAIDVINHYKDIKNMFTLTIESIMNKLYLTDNNTNNSKKNIFDILADEINT
ncbi:MAG: phage antirepressor N-terminal domain-containing protein [Coprobacillus sp.]|nr:phage antirepressor N-terminal domain-containing protein [Coprobacillus sp.]